MKNSPKEKTGQPIMGGRFYYTNQYKKALVAISQLIFRKIRVKIKNVKFFSPISDKKIWSPSKAPHFNKPTRNNLLQNQSLQKYNQKIKKSSQLSDFGDLIFAINS